MEEKKGLRYYTPAIIFLILASVIISNIVAVFSPIFGNFLEDRVKFEDRIIRDASYSTSLYPSLTEINGDKVRNYRDYYTSNDIFNKNFIKYYSLKNYSYNGKNIDYYMTNDKLYTDNDKKELEIVKKKIENPYILFRYSNGRNEVEVVNGEKLTDIQNKYKDHVYYELKNMSYDDLSEYEKIDINSVEAIYEFTPEINSLSDYIENSSSMLKISSNIIILAILNFAFFSLFALFTSYEKSKNVRFYKSIKSIPIEVLLVMIAIAFMIGYFSVIYVFGYLPEMGNFIPNKVVMSFSFSLALVVMIISTYHLFTGLKSLYHEGLKSYVFQNSIIVRLTKGVFSLIRRILSRLYRMIVGNNITNKRKRFLSFILFAFLASIPFGFRPDFVFWILVALSIIYYVMGRFLGQVQEIEEATEKIKNGDFDIKLEEENTYFGNINKNLNNIKLALNNAMEKELKSERLKTELISNVSHDLKTPLTSMINYSELAQDSTLSEEERRKYLEIVNEKSNKLKQLIENLFEVAKVSSNNVKLNKMQIDLNQMIEQMIGEWDQEFASKNLQVVFNTNKEATILELDGEQTSRIFDNLFSNIYKYAQENTRVYVDLNQAYDTVISFKNVSKYALNISPDELRERFTRGDESRNTEGSGLGLAIASSLTELQGGTFDIQIDGDLFKIKIVF